MTVQECLDHIGNCLGVIVSLRVAPDEEFKKLISEDTQMFIEVMCEYADSLRRSVINWDSVETDFRLNLDKREIYEEEMQKRLGYKVPSFNSITEVKGLEYFKGLSLSDDQAALVGNSYNRLLLETVKNMGKLRKLIFGKDEQRQETEPQGLVKIFGKDYGKYMDFCKQEKICIFGKDYVFLKKWKMWLLYDILNGLPENCTMQEIESLVTNAGIAGRTVFRQDFCRTRDGKFSEIKKLYSSFR